MKFTQEGTGTVDSKTRASYLPEASVVNDAAGAYALATTPKAQLSAFDTIANLVDDARENLTAGVINSSVDHFRKNNTDRTAGYQLDTEFEAYGRHKGRCHVNDGGTVVASVNASCGELMKAAVARGDALRAEYTTAE